MADYGIRRKRRPRERPVYRDREFTRDSYNARNDYGYSDSREKHTPPPTALMKPPVILAKPDSISSRTRPQVSSPVNETTKLTKPSMNSSSTGNRFSSNATPENSHHDKFYGQNEQKSYPGKLNFQKYHSTQKNAKHTPSPASPLDSSAMKTPDEESGDVKPVKILDGLLHWTDTGIDLLEDQTHFLVVGVLGEQGVGKSTIMSYLAGSDLKVKNLIFPCQTRDCVERASNMTVGVDMFVTEERTIFLDAQPILSPALLEQCIYNDRKMSAEYNGPAIGIEMQSLQLATFLFTVCHVVVVVQDWFTDLKLYNFLQCAEMLKLTSPTSSGDSVNSESEFEEFYPHLIFVQNKAEHSLFDPSCLTSMTETISNLLAHSKLLHKGSISLSKSTLFPNLSSVLPISKEVNLFLVPLFTAQDKYRDGQEGNSEDTHFQKLPEYTTLPDAEHTLRIFRNMILSVRRVRLTRQPLTEKNWFYYAAKTWEAIKKSQMMAEFNRLLV